MARIEITIRDDKGQILGQLVDEAVTPPSLSLQGVESAVEQWKH